jgi:DNA-binding NtrC family response regulator
VGESAGHEAASQEILVVDGDPGVLRGLERLFRDVGFAVTPVTDPERARDQITNRFFGVALIDLDTPTPLAGIELLRFAKEKSPLTAVFVMTARKAFEAVAPAFRAGALDVVPKAQDAVAYLRERVLTASRELRATQSREQLLGEVAELHEEFLRQMMELSRHATDLEDKILRRDGEESTSAIPTIIELLVVDDDTALTGALEHGLTQDRGWRVRFAQTGGEALDGATQSKPHILVVKETLPDLPAGMLVKTIKASAPDLVALVFSPPGEGGGGEVKMMEASRLIPLVSSFSDPQQLVGVLEDVREALRRKAAERRYLTVFRKQHFAFLKRYNGVKQKLAQKG